MAGIGFLHGCPGFGADARVVVAGKLLGCGSGAGRCGRCAHKTVSFKAGAKQVRNRCETGVKRMQKGARLPQQACLYIVQRHRCLVRLCFIGAFPLAHERKACKPSKQSKACKPCRLGYASCVAKVGFTMAGRAVAIAVRKAAQVAAWGLGQFAWVLALNCVAISGAGSAPYGFAGALLRLRACLAPLLCRRRCRLRDPCL